MKMIILMVVGSLAVSCSNSKEQEMKKMMGEANKAADAVTVANKNPTFENLTNAGLSLSNAKQHEKALEYFEKAMKLQPKNSVAHNNVCAEFNALGKWGMAIKHCQESLALSPTFQLAKNNLKFSQDKKAAQLKVIQNLKAKADASQGKDRQSALVDLGFEYYKMGSYDEAVSVWKKVSKTNDDLYARTLNNLGSAYIIMKKFDLAKASLEEAARLQPQNQLVKNNMAWLKTESAQK